MSRSAWLGGGLPLFVPSPARSKGNKHQETQKRRENTKFLHKHLGFALNSPLQRPRRSRRFLHFKVGIFNANAAAQPNAVPAAAGGAVGVRAPSALLAAGHGILSWGNPGSCPSMGWRWNSSEDFAQGGARVEPFIAPHGAPSVGEVVAPPCLGRRQL